MSNKRPLQIAKKELTKAKAPSKPRDIIYDPMGQWKHPGQNTRIPGSDITMQGVSYPVYAEPNIGEPQMMYPGQEYAFPGADYVDEYPQMKRGGYMKGLVPMPKPSKKGLASKAYSRSLDATNRLFTENYLFRKPKDRKRKVFDPNAKYYADGGNYGMPLGAGVSQNFIGNRDNFKVGGIPELPLRDNQVNYNAFVNGFEPMSKKQDGGEQDAMNAMMKARLAYANEFGNPAAQRMINLPDNPYQFDDGNTGTHYMASMDNYAVPQIQDENGQLMLGDYGPESNEAIRFDTDDDANYFAEHYKDVSPGFIETELTDDEIQAYKEGGYIVEEAPDYKKGGALLTKKVTCKKCGWNWDAADGGNDVTTCHKCGGQGLVHAQKGGDISIPSLTKAQRGLFKKKDKELAYREPVNVQDDLVESVTPFPEAPEDFKKGVANIKEVEVAPHWIEKSREYSSKHNKQAFIDKKKRQYLKNTNRGLSKAAGISMENFPESVEKNFLKEYNYKKNNYVVKNLFKDAGLSPNKREEWADSISEADKVLIANSKYGDKLKPSIWNRTLAGLGTIASKFSPEIDTAMDRGDLPGLTRDEQRAIKNANIKGIPVGGLEALAGADAVGIAIANAVEASGNESYGGDYKEAPSLTSGNVMPKITDDQIAVLNPFTYTAGYDFAPIAKGVIKGAAKIGKASIKGGKKIGKNISNLNLKPASKTLKTNLNGYAKGGESKYVDTELTEDEIQDLIDEGYIVEIL
jgi:hypothetical protein